VIELLGVGLARAGGRWSLHRVCATLEAGELTVVVSDDDEERRALLDAIVGRRVPEEGRVWVNRVPVMQGAAGRVRRLSGEVDPRAVLVERRSLFWNALAPVSGPRALGRLLRLPRWREREAVRSALDRVGLRARADEPVAALSAFDRVRLLIARALARRPRNLIVHDPDAAVAPGDVGSLLAMLRLLAHTDRLAVVVSLADHAAARSFADRLLVLREGLLVFHGRAPALDAVPTRWRAGALTR
jgi:ABC-type phosphate/phosphonate transport system ATPase subunit